MREHFLGLGEMSFLKVGKGENLSELEIAGEFLKSRFCHIEHKRKFAEFKPLAG